MTATEAFKLSDKIVWHYGRRSKHSTGINDAIALALGPDLYKSFCKEVKNSVDKNFSGLEKNFSPKFLDNPVRNDDCMNDMEVSVNYTLTNILQTIAKIIE